MGYPLLGLLQWGCDLDEPLACLELGTLLGSNLDGFAGTRVAARAGRTVDYAEGTKANEGDLFTLGKLLFDHINVGIQRFGGIHLSDLCFLCHGGN